MSPNVLVVGAGVGGISTALWLRDRHVTFDWVEATTHIGGTLRRVGNPIDELAGLKAHSGIELVERYLKQLKQLKIMPQTGREVREITPLCTGGLRVAFASNNTSTYDAVILCTGTRPRMLNLPYESTLLGRGVEVSVTRTRERYRHKQVAVIGGGDAALEGVLLLAEVTHQLHLIHRGSEFRAQARFIRQVREHPHITLHLEQQVRALVPSAQQDKLAGVILSNGEELPIEGLFVRIGVTPHYPKGIHPSRPEGYLQSDISGRSSIPGLYIVGDVGTAHHQSVGWAMGSAARAVFTLCHDLRAHFETP